MEAHDRAGLKQLRSYVTSPPLAAGSLEKVGDDKYLFKLKSSWSDGTSCSKLYCFEQWLREDVRIQGTDSLALQHLYRAMDFLEANKEAIAF